MGLNPAPRRHPQRLGQRTRTGARTAGWASSNMYRNSCRCRVNT